METALFKTQPYQHQLEALNACKDKREYALFMEMGCGKSKVVIDDFANLYREKKINGVLIIAPKGVYDNWYSKEIPAHLPDDIDYNILKWSPAGTQKNKLNLERILMESNRLHIFVMNIEALSTKKGTDFAVKFINNKQSMFIIDESTTIKNPSAKRTMNAVRLGKYAEYRRILTGSPVTKSPLDLFSQCMFLDPSLLGFSSYYAFRSRYADLMEQSSGGRVFKVVKGYKNLEELNETLKTFSFRVLKKDCLDLPDKIYLRRTIEMTDEQKKVYRDIQKNAQAVLSEGKVTINHIITQIIRLHQIACGFVNTDEGLTKELKSNRLNELLEILEEVDGKVIIWANYRHDIKKIVQSLRERYGSYSVGEYHGDIEQAEREETLTRFQDMDDKMRFFVGNTQTGGYGITLTAASTVIYYSNNYDLEKRLQSEDRAHRIGQKNNVTYIDIVCEKTVDEKIVRALRLKQSIAQTVLGEETWKDWLT
jgi:SNF2 family DNA or RNA helicase|tara:strand:- start:14415 stop:15857 length:1443 start_codon:yes stop_codon:yes gene_type:complete